MTVVVLGWDGLDYDLAQRYDLADAFGERHTRLETYENEAIGKPHTYEVWPTIITGLLPADHGIHADEYTEGGSWSNPLLNVATAVSKYAVPERLRWAVGRRIRDAGATFDFESLDYYAENDIWTIFDKRQSYPLAIPNARSAYDDELDIVIDRGAQLAAFMDIETGEGGETVHSPSVPLRAFATKLEADLGQKLGAVRTAVQWDFDLVFVWLGYLDTVGHVGPTVTDSEAWIRSGYETAAAWTAFIRQMTADTDQVVCVSDHGLKAGAHTDAAFFGSWGDAPTEQPSSVLDVAETIDAIAPRSGRLDGPHSASEQSADYDTVEERLKDLGYV